jgi:ATP-binding cassette, subfamily C, bacterial CydD
VRAITEPPDPTVNQARCNRQWLQDRSRGLRACLLAAVAAGFLGGLATLLQLGLTAWLIHSTIVLDTPLAEQLWLLAALLCTVLVRALALALQNISGARAAHRVRQSLRKELMHSWDQQGPVRLAGESSAVLASEWVEQADALEGYFARFQPQLWLAVLIPLSVLVVAFSLDWLAALFLLLAAPLIPLFMILVGMGAERLNQQHFAAVSRLAGHFLDRVRGLATLQLFGQSERAVRDVAEASEDYRRLNMRTLRVAFLSSAVLEFFASVSIAVVAIYVGFGLLGYIQFGPAGELTLFSGLFVLLLAPEFFQPLRTLSQHYHDRAAALGAADALVTLLERPVPPEQQAPSIPGMAGRTGARIEIDAAEVHHPGRGCVLGPVSMDISPGEFVAVAGPSGAGKTTLLYLLAGFRRPDAGRVLIDAAAPAGHGGFAWMDQRPFLMQGTIADNLRLAAPRATTARLLDAVYRAGLQNYLQQLPDGLETVIGERGHGLSGGQAQRVALARLFLSDAPLGLLDEPTASLDEYSEQRVLDSLKLLADDGRTIVAATHHPTVLAMADRVIRLQAGRVTEAHGHA